MFSRVRERGHSTLVLDADVLIKMARGGRADVLRAARSEGLRCLTTRTVAKELRHRAQREALLEAGLEIVSFGGRDPEVRGLYEALLTKCMEPGEASVFAVAQHFGFAAVTDDVLAKVAYIEYRTPPGEVDEVLATEQVLEDFLDAEHDPEGVSLLAALHLELLSGEEIPGAWRPSARRWWRAERLAEEIAEHADTPAILRGEGVMTAPVVGRMASEIRYRGDPLGLEIKSTRGGWGAGPLCRPLYSYLAHYGKLGHQYNFVARNALRKYAWVHPALPLAIAQARAGGHRGPVLPDGSLGTDRYVALRWAQKFRNSFARHLTPYAAPDQAAASCPPGGVEAAARGARPDCGCGRRMGLRGVLALPGEEGLWAAEYHCAVCDALAESLWREER